MAPWSGAVFRAAALQGALLVSARCGSKHDPHGNWTGSTDVSGTYTLVCDRGYSVSVIEDNVVVQRPNTSISCRKGNRWHEDPACSNIDDCRDLRNGCGPKGVCRDDVDGYHCECERGAEWVQATDGSNEWVCAGACGSGGGNTCGAHGVCVDLREEDDEFDTGLNSSYRCSCTAGYYDSGWTCVPKDCGNKTDAFGVWHGETAYGGRYKLTCDVDSYIYGGPLQAVTISCPKNGTWREMGPRCINAAQEARDARVETARFWLAMLGALACILCAALAAGLTMGLVSLQDFEMKLLMQTRKEDCDTVDQQERLARDQEAAERVGPLLRDHHMLLVTLLLLNSVANEALPIFLDQVVPSYLAVLISVTCVLFFGEILPAAIFTGPSQLSMAAIFAPVVRCLECVLCPVAKPLALILDCMIGGHGDHGSKYHRAELQALLRLHEPEHARNDRAGGFVEARCASFVSGSSAPPTDGGGAQPGQQCPSFFALPAGERPDAEAGPGENGHGGPDAETGPGEHGHGGPDLHWLECTLAKRCLRLGSLRMQDLRLAPPHAPVPGAGREDAAAPQVLHAEMTVAEAIDALLRDTPEGLPAAARGPGGERVTLEGLLRAALLPRAI